MWRGLTRSADSSGRLLTLNTISSTPSRPLLAAIRDGWQSAKANVVPGLVIVSLAGLIVVAYYRIPAVDHSLQGVQKFREKWGVWFSMAASAFGAGMVPGLYLILTRKEARRGRRTVVDFFYTCLVWASSAVVIDRFYAFQAWLWGQSVTLPILFGKIFADQFIFTPVIGIQIPAFGFRLRDMNYDLRALKQSFQENWLIKVIVPMLVACWLTWIPGTLVIYSLPLSLEIPMMVLIQCFFALEIAYASSKM
jgi:hypothetical protein